MAKFYLKIPKNISVNEENDIIRDYLNDLIFNSTISGTETFGGRTGNDELRNYIYSCAFNDAIEHLNACHGGRGGGVKARREFLFWLNRLIEIDKMMLENK